MSQQQPTPAPAIGLTEQGMGVVEKNGPGASKFKEGEHSSSWGRL